MSRDEDTGHAETRGMLEVRQEVGIEGLHNRRSGRLCGREGGLLPKIIGT